MSNINKYKSIIVLIFAILAIILAIVLLARLTAIQNGEEIVIESSMSQEGSIQGESKEDFKEQLIYVDIQGAVNNPGVYEFSEGSIVEDALKIAGGLSGSADIEYVEKHLNRALKLTDEQKIYVPAKGEEVSIEEGHSYFGNDNEDYGKININTATIEQLDSLSGIGPAYAQRIIDERPYSTIEEIKSVKGIGSATFEKIKDKITV